MSSIVPPTGAVQFRVRLIDLWEKQQDIVVILKSRSRIFLKHRVVLLGVRIRKVLIKCTFVFSPRYQIRHFLFNPTEAGCDHTVGDSEGKLIRGALIFWWNSFADLDVCSGSPPRWKVKFLSISSLLSDTWIFYTQFHEYL